MMRLTSYETAVIRSRDLKNNYFSLTLGPYPKARHCLPGSFVHIKIPNSELYFRRAMSVASVDAERGEVEIIFKIFGRGTKLLSAFHRNDLLNILGPLGTSFTRPRKNERLVLVGGGVGFPPLLYLATYLISNGFPANKIEFFYGGRTAGEIVERNRIKKLKLNFHPVTDDGSYGSTGLVTDEVEKFVTNNKSEKLRLYGCGPEGMLKAIDLLGVRHSIPGQLSIEAPMPCGFGVCLGCVVELRRGGHARVCYDGPVFEIGEVLL